MTAKHETMVRHYNFFSMGTRFDLVLSGIGEKDGSILAERLSAECERIENLISIHRPGSALSLLNTSAHAGAVETETELKEIIRDLKYFHRLTRGYFDPACAGCSETGTAFGIETVEVLQEGVIFNKSDVKLDLGGYGKGYAVKRLLPMLQNAGVGSALLSFGESLLYGIGSHPFGKGWPLAIPGTGAEEGATFNLENEALSVSGNSLNNRKKFANSGHIVNPLTGKTRDESGIVCVKSKDPITAEVFSTALFSAGREKTEELLQFPGADLDVRWVLE